MMNELLFYCPREFLFNALIEGFAVALENNIDFSFNRPKWVVDVSELDMYAVVSLDELEYFYSMLVCKLFTKYGWSVKFCEAEALMPSPTEMDFTDSEYIFDYNEFSGEDVWYRKISEILTAYLQYEDEDVVSEGLVDVYSFSHPKATKEDYEKLTRHLALSYIEYASEYGLIVPMIRLRVQEDVYIEEDYSTSIGLIFTDLVKLSKALQNFNETRP